MPDWQQFSPYLKDTINSIIGFAKARKREEATLGLAAIFKTCLPWQTYTNSPNLL